LKERLVWFCLSKTKAMELATFGLLFLHACFCLSKNTHAKACFCLSKNSQSVALLSVAEHARFCLSENKATLCMFLLKQNQAKPHQARALLHLRA
jgi:hypothetical protein